MKHRIPTRSIHIVTLLAVSIVSLMFVRVANMQESGNPTIVKGGGLQVVTFNVPAGRVKVNLPDDMAAGDTISGTVIAEPSGKTDKEKQRNTDTLQGFVIELEQQKRPVSDATMGRIIVGPGAASPRLILLDGKGKQVGAVTVPVAPTSNSPTSQSFPRLGQTGRPLEIHGPFDGDSSNTSARVGNSDAKVLAESPRKVVIESPREVVGPTNIEVKENNSSSTGEFRNLKIDLTAPKTSLLRGESTELHVQVTGLEGLTQPVNVQLQNQSPGTVQLSGGNTQTQTVRPQDVQTGGAYTWNGNVTGVQSGGYVIVATIPSGTYFQEGPLTNPNGPIPIPDPTKTEPAKDPGRLDPGPLHDPGPGGGAGLDGTPNRPINPNPPNPGQGSGNNPQLADCHCVALTVTPTVNQPAIDIINLKAKAAEQNLPDTMDLKVTIKFTYNMQCKGNRATHCKETITWKPKANVVFSDPNWTETKEVVGEEKTLPLDSTCHGDPGSCEATSDYAVTTTFKDIHYPAAFIAKLKNSGRDAVLVGKLDVTINWEISAGPTCGSLSNVTTTLAKPNGGKFHKGDDGLYKPMK